MCFTLLEGGAFQAALTSELPKRLTSGIKAGNTPHSPSETGEEKKKKNTVISQTLIVPANASTTMHNVFAVIIIHAIICVK